MGSEEPSRDHRGRPSDWTEMSGTLILLQLGGYVGLLLWGTHMVSTGVERGFGAELRQWLGRRLSPPGRGARLRAMMIGLAVTAVLQSSTATGLMATSFAARGALDLAPALAVMLGANLGSTLITQALAFDITAMAPLLVLIGVVLFRSSADGRGKNLGRVAIGFGLMLLALGALGRTLVAVETAPPFRAVLEALTGEPVLALLIAGALTWACHSSVAVVLLIASLAASGVIAPAASLALVLGANLGGTLPPLFEAGSGVARRLPLGNLLVRGAGCIVALLLLAMIAGLLAHIEAAPARPRRQFPHRLQPGARGAVFAVHRSPRGVAHLVSSRPSAASRPGKAHPSRAGRARQRECGVSKCGARDLAHGRHVRGHAARVARSLPFGRPPSRGRHIAHRARHGSARRRNPPLPRRYRGRAAAR